LLKTTREIRLSVGLAARCCELEKAKPCLIEAGQSRSVDGTAQFYSSFLALAAHGLSCGGAIMAAIRMHQIGRTIGNFLCAEQEMSASQMRPLAGSFL